MEVLKQINLIRDLLVKKMNNNVESIDLLLSLLLGVIEFEIIKNNTMSDKTGEALIQITSFQRIEYYYHGGYLELNTELSKLAGLLQDYNDKFKEYELGVVGTDPKDWGSYFKEQVENHLNNWES